MFDNIDPLLLPFIDSESRQLLQQGVLSVADHQALLDEAKLYRERWLATLHPTREQILGVAHQTDRDHVAFGESSEQHWKALEADWCRKQKPTAEDVFRARNPALEQPKAEPETKKDETPHPTEPTESSPQIFSEVYFQKQSEALNNLFGFTLAEPSQKVAEDSTTIVRPGPATSEIREDGHSDAEVASYFERRYAPRNQDIFEELPESGKRSLWEKFWKLTESNLFMGGGIGLALAAYAFLIGGAPRFAIFLLVCSWIVISVSVYRHKFFEGKKRRWEIMGNAGISASVALALAVLWFLLRPSALIAVVQLPQKSSTSQLPSPKQSQSPSPPPRSLSTLSPSPTVGSSSVGGHDGPTTSAGEVLHLVPCPPPCPAPAYFNGEISFTGGASHSLASILKASGYKGPMVLETLEFYNPSDVNVCWRVGSAKERCSGPGDGYNFPGGADATQVYVSAKVDAKLDIGLKSRAPEP